MASTVLRELINLITFKVDQATLKAAEQRIKSVADGLASFGTRMSIGVSAPLAALAKFSVDVASNTNETKNKFNQVFGEMAGSANAFVGELSRATGRFSGDIQNGMAAFDSMFVGLGFGNKQAAEMSQRMQALAIDFGSFNNLSDEESIQRFVSAMSGSSQVLDMFGINIKDSAMNLELQALGIGKTTQKATEAEKALARLSIIEKTMGRQGAIGDAVRTLDQFANKSRAFGARIKELQLWIGEKLIPVLSRLMDVGTRMMDRFDGLSEASKKTLLIFAALTAAAGPLALALSGLLSIVRGLALLQGFLGAGQLLGAGGALKMLGPHFLLVAAAILAAFAAAALFFDEVDTWMSGGDSLLGRLLGPWEQWRDGLKNVLDTAQKDFDLFASSLGVAMWEALVELVNIKIPELNKALESSPIGRLIKLLLGGYQMEYAAKSVSAVAGGAGSALGWLTQDDTARNANLFTAYNKRAQDVAATKRVHVESTIKMELPAGTDEFQKKYIEKAAADAVDIHLSRQLRTIYNEEAIDLR